MTDVVVGVDGGNSKTEVGVATTSGDVLGMRLGPGSSPDKLGGPAAADTVASLVAQAVAEHRDAARVTHVAALLAGLDLPGDAPAFAGLLRERLPGVEVHADNDTSAALLLGTGGGPGAVVVVGAGINAVARSEAGNRAGFPSLGPLTGDWGGGISLGRDVLHAAVRHEDGRGTPTALTGAVRRRFGSATALDVALRILRGDLPESELASLVPGLMAADTEGDGVARGLVDRLVGEVATMARVVLGRVGLLGSRVPVVLAGGVLTAGHDRLDAGVREALAEQCPAAIPTLLAGRPVSGAIIAALGLAHGGRPPADVVARVLSALGADLSGGPGDGDAAAALARPGGGEADGR